LQKRLQAEIEARRLRYWTDEAFRIAVDRELSFRQKDGENLDPLDCAVISHGRWVSLVKYVADRMEIDERDSV
jgi:hypothetical protein